jgi:glucose-6-phosphate 1-epimerase
MMAGADTGQATTFHGQPAVVLATAAGDRAVVLLHGAHVVSWTPAGGREWLYLSPASAFGDCASIRGGVPVIFPQFNQRGPDFDVPRHGFARNRRWRLETHGGDSAMLVLGDDDATRRLWPHAFVLRLSVRLSQGRLELDLEAVNTGSTAFAFTAALHTYFAVADISSARLHGLQGVRFLDTVAGASGSGPDAALRFAGETDGIWYDLPRSLLLETSYGALEIAMDGFPDAVVWNPWVERAAALPDLPDDDYRRMLCVEAAVIERPVRLERGAAWRGRQVLMAR